MPLPDKRKILDALVAQLTVSAAQMAEHARATREGATHAEAKPENDKDTRALEQSYLARGQAMRVEELAEQAQLLRFMPLQSFAADAPISARALVLLEADDGERLLFIAPHGGGVELVVDGCEVLVVTPASPLGRAVLGRGMGDDVVLTVRGKRRDYVVANVS